MLRTILVLMLTSLLVGCATEQVPNKSYSPPIVDPAYKMGEGSLVCLDEAHNNFHTLDNRFWAFGELLRQDGYTVEASREKFSAAVLERCSILVISNAQLESDEWSSYPYPTPSAFTGAEIEAVQTWVDGDGALLLIADHMPLAGAAAGLASTFGVEFNDGFADTGFEGEENRGATFDIPTIFSLETGTLVSHPITNGRTTSEAVMSIRSFTGQAFLVGCGQNNARNCLSGLSEYDSVGHD